MSLHSHRVPRILQADRRWNSLYDVHDRQSDEPSRFGLPRLVANPVAPRPYEPDPLVHGGEHHARRIQAVEFVDYMDHLTYQGVTEDIANWLPTYNPGRLRSSHDLVDKIRYFKYCYNTTDWDRSHPTAKHREKLGHRVRTYVFTIFAVLLGLPRRAHFVVVYSLPHLHDNAARFGVESIHVDFDPTRWFLVDATMTFHSNDELTLLNTFSEDEIRDLVVPYALGLASFGSDKPESQRALFTSPLVRTLYRPRFIEVVRIRESREPIWSQSSVDLFGSQPPRPLRVELVGWFTHSTHTNLHLDESVNIQPSRALFQRATTSFFPSAQSFPPPGDFSPARVIDALIDDYRRDTISMPTHAHHFALQQLQGAKHGKWDETCITDFTDAQVYLILRRSSVWTYVHFLLSQHFLLGQRSVASHSDEADEDTDDSDGHDDPYGPPDLPAYPSSGSLTQEYLSGPLWEIHDDSDYYEEIANPTILT